MDFREGEMALRVKGQCCHGQPPEFSLEIPIGKESIGSEKLSSDLHVHPPSQ